MPVQLRNKIYSARDPEEAWDKLVELANLSRYNEKAQLTLKNAFFLGIMVGLRVVDCRQWSNLITKHAARSKKETES